MKSTDNRNHQIRTHHHRSHNRNHPDNYPRHTNHYTRHLCPDRSTGRHIGPVARPNLPWRRLLLEMLIIYTFS